MQPLAVHHVSINVSDPERSIAFYTDVLGGTLRGDRPDFSFGGAWIDLGGQQVHLIEADVPPNLGQHFAILVADLDEAVAELRSKGYRLPDAMPVGTGRQTFVEDPDANLVELHEAAGAG